MEDERTQNEHKTETKADTTPPLKSNHKPLLNRSDRIKPSSSNKSNRVYAQAGNMSSVLTIKANIIQVVTIHLASCLEDRVCTISLAQSRDVAHGAILIDIG